MSIEISLKVLLDVCYLLTTNQISTGCSPSSNIKLKLVLWSHRSWKIAPLMAAAGLLGPELVHFFCQLVWHFSSFIKKQTVKRTKVKLSQITISSSRGIKLQVRNVAGDGRGGSGTPILRLRPRLELGLAESHTGQIQLTMQRAQSRRRLHILDAQACWTSP